MQFKYSCTLVEQPGEPLSIRCELQTRYPAFWCSACTSDCHDPPVDAATECGAAALPDKRSRDFKQLSPDHVAVVYTMLTKDGKANLQELKEVCTKPLADNGMICCMSFVIAPQVPLLTRIAVLDREIPVHDQSGP